MSEVPPYQAAVPRPPASAIGAWPRSLGASSMVAIVGLSSTIVAAVIGLGVQLDSNAGDGLAVLHPTLIVVTLIFAGVAFISWLYRARVNLDYFGVHSLRWRPGWTIGSWFIPFANFVIPVRVINEVDRASAERADAADGGRSRPPYGRVVFVLWAITWTSYLLLDRYPRAGTPGLIGLPARELDKASALSVVSTAMGIAAAVCAILLVRRVTANQDRVLATALGVPAHPVPGQGAGYPERYPQAPHPQPLPEQYPQTLPQQASYPPPWGAAAPSKDPTPPQQRPSTAPRPDPMQQPVWADAAAPPMDPIRQQPPAAAEPDPAEEPPPPASDPWPSAGF